MGARQHPEDVSDPAPDFSTFYAAAWPRLLRTTYAVAGDRQLAEDAVQAAFASAYAVWPRVRRATDPFAYVRKAAVNAALAQHRKAHRRRETTVESLPEVPVPVGADPADRQAVLGAVRGLPPRQRAVVVLRYYEDLSEQQIADLLGVRPGTVKSQASAALATLRSELASGLADVDPGPGDRQAVERAGTRLRRRRRVVAGASALAVVLVLGVLALVRPGRSDDDAVEPAPPVGGTWRDLAPMPLTPRWDPLAVWTGEEVLVVGGYVADPCPPSASCTRASETTHDGAAYDPATDTWRPIAEAPVDLASWSRAAWVADRLVVLSEDRWWSYDPAADRWAAIPDPPRRMRDLGYLPVADEGLAYALSRPGDLWALDVARATWARVPQGSPDGFRRESVVVTDTLVFSGRLGNADPTVVDLGRGELVETGQGGPFRHWTGDRLVELDLDSSGDGLPGGGRLDPATGEWSPLPNAPALDADRGDGWSPVANDGPLMAGWGYVYDDRTGRWTTLGLPPATEVDSGQAAVWADGALVLVGGLDEDTAYDGSGGISADAWSWTP